MFPCRSTRQLERWEPERGVAPFRRHLDASGDKAGKEFRCPELGRRIPRSLAGRRSRLAQLGDKPQRRRARTLTDAFLTVKITQIHEQSRGVYGVPRIHVECAWSTTSASGASGSPG
jgi:hypothetical protein